MNAHLTCIAKGFQFFGILAGVVGFEPTIHGTKNRCLAAWLHPTGTSRTTCNLHWVASKA